MHLLDVFRVPCALLGMPAVALTLTILLLVLLVPIQKAMPHLVLLVQLDSLVLQRTQPLIPVLLVLIALWVHCLVLYALLDHTVPLWISYLSHVHQVRV